MLTAPRLALLCLSFPTIAGAGVFDSPRNLHVLPDGIGAAELRATMVGFTRALGIRCATCHDGDEGQPLSTYDFASDEKQPKRTARSMLRMVNAINSEYLQKNGIDTAVSCMSCHRGVARPAETQQLLVEALNDGGLAALETRYRSLRQRYYGTHSYDFSERVLIDVARTVGNRSPRLALAILRRNLHYFEAPFDTWYALGQVHAQLGDRAQARDAFRTALEIRSDPRAVKALAALDEESAR